MNKKIKMFIICAVFAVIISCKNYASNKDLKSLEESSESSDSKLSKSEQELKKQVKGFLDILETKDLSNLDEKDTKEIEKTIEDLKNKIDKSNSKKTSLATYFVYEGLTKQVREKLKGKGGLEDKFKGLEDSLKEKKGDRQKELEEVKKKFEELKSQVVNTAGQTYGHQVQRQGGVGQQAWKYASDLGFRVDYSISTSVNSDDFAKKVIEGALEKIKKELEKDK
ncbi:ErpL protein (plasmid) [Borreliella garinii]|uniref:ErpL protein n=1 Tax=Borreliella garinii TaxID=29519 RepID=UPI002B4BE062|nr:ErpL protein [Borreliella garinii]WRM49047.1 ErpL protein [Borreliella garinii]